MKLVVGLGNPGSRYARTRHNVGFRLVDALVARAGDEAKPGESESSASTTACRISDQPLILAKPNTFMNLSGIALRELREQYAPAPQDLLVAYDDADLELGRIRFRQRGGTGGHRGMRSILEHVGDDGFGRLKIGVRGTAREARDLAGYVLDEFDSSEEPLIRDVIRLSCEAVETWVNEEFSTVMNEYNGQTLTRSGGTGT